MDKKKKNGLWGAIAALVVLVAVVIAFSVGGNDVTPAQSFSGGAAPATSTLIP